MYIRDEYKCVYCDRDMKERFDDWMNIENDHLIPAVKGGGDGLDNRVTSCSVCNKFKSAYLPGNFSSLSKEELLDEIRKYVLGKREEWKVTYQEALVEYEEQTG